jgi:hypothetical protein
VNERILPSALFALGALGVARAAHREPAFATGAGLATASAIAFVCGLYHFELRYFALLVPLAALGVAALVPSGASAAASRPGRASTLLLGAGALAALLCVGASAVAFALGQRAIGRLPDGRPCPGALSFLAQGLEPGERVLSFVPEHVTLWTGHQAITIPSGGETPIAAAARHYGAHWLLAHASAARPATSRFVTTTLPRRSRLLRVAPVYRGGACTVYRLDWPALAGR